LLQNRNRFPEREGCSELTAARSGKRSIRELAEIDPASFMKGEKTVFPGIGAGTLEKFDAGAFGGARR
jgi:hypothetical protein